jgi:cytochrome c556
MNRLTRIGVAVAVAAASTLAISQGAPNPEAQAKSAIEARQAIFKLIGTQAGAVTGLSRPNAPAPDMAAVARSAARIQTLADMIPELFTANPTAPAGVKTRALPVIWTGAADFKAKAEALSKAAGAVADAAKKGDAAAAKTAAGDVSKACQSCHETYRGPVVP